MFLGIHNIRIRILESEAIIGKNKQFKGMHIDGMLLS